MVDIAFGGVEVVEWHVLALDPAVRTVVVVGKQDVVERVAQAEVDLGDVVVVVADTACAAAYMVVAGVIGYAGALWTLVGADGGALVVEDPKVTTRLEAKLAGALQEDLLDEPLEAFLAVAVEVGGQMFVHETHSRYPCLVMSREVPAK